MKQMWQKVINPILAGVSVNLLLVRGRGEKPGICTQTATELGRIGL